MKFTKKLLLSLLAFAFAVGMAKAQVVEVGYLSLSDGYKNSNNLTGLYVGATYDMNIQGPISIHYGLLYNYAKNSEEVLKIERKSTFHALEIPVRAVLTFPMDKLRLSIFAGPNFNIGIKKEIELKSKFGTKTISEYDNDDYSRFNLQLGGGVAIRYDRLGIKASYDFGLTKLLKDVDESKIDAFKVGIFYNF